MAGTGTSHLRQRDETLISVEGLVVEYPVAHSHDKVHAVSGISLDVKRGETLGLVGESGCGKSTLGRAVLQMPRPTAGSVFYDGVDLTQLPLKELTPYRRRMQMIFQDPVASLHPRWSAGRIVTDPLTVHKAGSRGARRQKAAELLNAVGLDPGRVFDLRPHQLSGGQCQRVAIARSLALDPDVIVCDEPVSALDVSVQAQILNLLEDMKGRYGLTLVFITHDLAVVHNVSDRIAVMYLGKLCEVASSDVIYARPAHPYTDALINSIPVPDPAVRIQANEAMAMDLPSPIDPPSGCRFRTRCPRATDRCRDEEPQMQAVDDDHHVACHHPLVERHVDHTTTVTVSAGGSRV